MNKRALMLSAAAAALLTAPTVAKAATELTTVVSTAQKTSTTGDLTIDSGAGIKFKSATVPMLTIDSSNNVVNNGTFTGSGQTTQTAIEIDTTTASLGSSATPLSLESGGTIDLSGDGSGKSALHLVGVTGNSYTGNITFDSTSSITIQGDGSTGILTDSVTTLNGNVTLGGTLSMASTTVNETSSSGLSIAQFNGTTNGNIAISSASTFSAVGNGAVGIILNGPVSGTFSNAGALTVSGVSVRSTTKKNASSGSALVVANNVLGGILNDGPAAPGDVGSKAAASITANGTSAAAVLITPLSGAAAPVVIGKVSTDAANPDYSFINRGTISAVPEDPNDNARTMVISGLSSSAPVTLNGGIFNSGSISATAASGSLNGSSSSSSSSTPAGSAVTATALEIDNFVTIPKIYLSSQTLSSPTSSSTGGGSITASISGPKGGGAAAIFINGDSTSVPEIDIEAGSRVVALATVTDATAAGVNLTAVAIEDDSGSLSLINNYGTIQATTTTLNNGNTAIAQAVYAAKNSTGVTFNNYGTVVGDVDFGGGSDVYNVIGTSSAAASQTGSISFGANIAGTPDQLNVGTFANVAGTITSQGDLDVTVAQHGVLTVKNLVTSATTNLQVKDLTIDGGSSASAGTLNLTVSEGNATNATIVASDKVTFVAGTILNINYGSLLTGGGGTFQLIAAPHGGLDISQNDIDRYDAAIGGTGNIPFMLKDAGVSIDTTDFAGQDVLVLTAQVKTAADLGLTGYAKAMFAPANAAIANDPDLGAALIAGISDQKTAQKAFDAFAPDVSGGVRQLAISLTDQATGPVAARLRDLRLFAREPGDLTLWGTEFGEYVSTKGGTINKTSLTGALDDSGAVGGFKDHGFGFSLGIDEGSPDDGWYGAAFSFYSGDISEQGDKVSQTQSLWYMLTGYSTWRGKALFVDTQVNVGYGDFKGKRSITLDIPASATAPQTVFTREADSKRAGLVGSLGLTLGAMLKYGAITNIPQISFDGMALREEGYTEANGGVGFDLTVKPYYANSLRMFVGDEVRANLNFGDFYLQPSARLGYRYDFINDPVRLRAQFADENTTLNGNQPGPLFTLQGPDPSQGNYVAGAALNATTENWTIGLHYDFVRGTHNATEQVGAISLLGRI